MNHNNLICLPAKNCRTSRPGSTPPPPRNTREDRAFKGAIRSDRVRSPGRLPERRIAQPASPGGIATIATIRTRMLRLLRRRGVFGEPEEGDALDPLAETAATATLACRSKPSRWAWHHCQGAALAGATVNSGPL